MNSKLRSSLLALGAAALLVPTGATAAKPDKAASKGKSEQAKGKAKPKNTVFKGSVVSVDVATSTVVVKVAKTSSWGRRFKGQDVAFTVDKVKKLGVNDTNADGKKDINDVKAGDKAHVQARITKDSVAPLAARKFKVQYPEADEAPAPAPAP